MSAMFCRRRDIDDGDSKSSSIGAFVRIILDTNVLRADFGLTKPGTLVFLDYVRKTAGQIILPQLVVDELAAEYVRALDAAVRDRTNANEVIARLTRGAIFASPPVDVESECAKYIAFLQSALRVFPRHVRAHSPAEYESAFRRAVKHKRPCNEKGHGVRDALIWESVLAIGNKAQTGCAFISNDRAFSSPANDLHDGLANELKERGTSLAFYQGVDAFNAAHAIHVEHVDLDWVRRQVTPEELWSLVESAVGSSLRRKLRNRISASQLLQDPLVLSGFVEVDSFYISELSTGEFRIAIEASGTAEVELELEGDDVRRQLIGRPGNAYPKGSDDISVNVYVQLDGVLEDKRIADLQVVDAEIEF